MVICFSVSIFVPLIGLVSTYSAPTASLAILIEENGKIPSVVLNLRDSYWRGALEVETYYPAPSLLLAAFSIITGTPHDYLMFVPIANLAKVIYFVLAKRILNGLTKKRRRVEYDLLALVYYVFTTIGININAGSVTRAVIGTTLLTYFIYSFLIFVDKFVNKNLHSYTSLRSEYYVMTVLTLAIGLSYYTSTLSVLLISLLVPVAVWVFINSKKLTILHIFTISLILVIYNPFYYSIAKSLSFENFFANILEFIRVQLKLERTGEAFELTVGQVEIDLFTRITGIWFKYLLVLLSGLATIYIFVKTSIFLAKKRLSGTSDKLLWIYSLIVMSAFMSELPYSLYAPTISTRAIIMYGSLILIYAVKNMFENRKDAASRIIGASVLTIFILSSAGNLAGGWFYGLSEPFGYEKVYPALTYIEKYSSKKEPIDIALDAWYSALGLLRSIISSEYTIVAYEPLGRGTFILAESIQRNDLTTFLRYSCERGITYVLLNDNAKPIYGDEWGYAVTLKDKSLLKIELSTLYTKGEFHLLRIPTC